MIQVVNGEDSQGNGECGPREREIASLCLNKPDKGCVCVCTRFLSTHANIFIHTVVLAYILTFLYTFLCVHEYIYAVYKH